MIRKLLLIVVLIFLPVLSFSQSIWKNDINANNINSNSAFTSGQIVDPNITVSGILRSSGLSNSNANDRFNASGWPSTFNLNNYFEFTLTPNLGNAINFVSLVYSGQASNTTSFAIRSSVDSFGANIATPGASGGTISLSGASYQGITRTITFRVYAWGGSGTRQYSINDFTFNGTVNCVAPPSTTGVVICQGGTGALTASPYTSFVNTFTGSWNSSIDPIARRVQNSMQNSTNCSFDSQTRNYVAHTFTVTTSGAYTFKMSDTGNYDGAAYIYSGAYTPGNCSGSGSDYWRGDDDADGQAREPRITANLVTGVTYTIISTTYGNTGTVNDDFLWTITPPTSEGGIVLTAPVNWYNASGTLLKAGSSFNPINVPNSGLTNTNTPGTTIYYAGYGASCAKTAANFVINGNNTPTNSVGTYTLCIDGSSQTTGNVRAGEYALVNVIQGNKYTFEVGDVFSGLNEKLNILNASTDVDVSPSATNTGSAGTSIVDWHATFSGQVKVVISTGSCANNGTVGTGGIVLSAKSVGNSLDNPLATGTTDNRWRGHIYNWTSATVPPGGTSPSSVEATTPFSGTEYAGYYDETSESIVQGFGGDDVCFPVLSNGVQRASIRTEQFAVRYRMKSTKSGCHLVRIRADDGVRLYVDGVKVFDRWGEQAATTYENVLINLTGNNNLVLDYYENGGGNIIEFSMAQFNASSNSIATTTPAAVCSGSTPGVIDGSTYQYVGTEVNPTIQFQWESSTNPSGPWVNVTTGTGINSEDYTPAAITVNTTQNVTYYRRTVSAAYNGSCLNSSTPVSITTNPAPTAPTTNTTQPTCTNNTGTITVSNPSSGYGYSIDGTNYSNTNGIFPSLAPTTYNVTARNISTGCTSAATSVTINPYVSKQWNGSAGVSWSNPANWTPNGVPEQTDCVVIPNSATNKPVIDGAGPEFYAHTLSVGSTTTLTVNSDKILKLTNEITVNPGGSLIFNNNSSLMQSNKNAVNSGDITYKRETSVRRYDYTYWSSPLTLASGFTLKKMSPNTLSDKYTSYNPNASWVIRNADLSVMIPGEGYSVRGPQNFDIINPSVQTASFVGVPNNGDVVKTTVQNKFNLLGNPYPSAIDGYKLIGDTNIGTIYLWTHNTPPSNGGAGSKYKYASADYASFNLSGELKTGGDA
ncbi:PA14 domain-containing protein, partial [Flavobacterium johnsoniae]|uniref:PA14 domain-containing protein n=1 Tax=Flavobacterium johnsoniae TaxID=986 RepID=UPI000A97F559